MKGCNGIGKAVRALCACCALYLLNANANPMYPGDSCVWSIPSQQIPVPAGYCVTEAILTVRNISWFNQDSSRLRIYVMPDRTNGFYKAPQIDTSNCVFNKHALLLAEIEPNNIINNFIQLRLGQLTNNASVALKLSTPLPVHLADGVSITLSPAVQQFMDILGSSPFLAFGFESNGITLGQISLLVTCKAYTGSAGSTAFLVSYGNLNPPVLNPLADQATFENQTISFTLDACDLDDTSLFYYGLNLPEGSVMSGNCFTWTPSWTQAGIYHPGFIVSDGKNSSYKEMAITVLDVNRPPVFSCPTIQTGQERKLLTFSLLVQDPDGKPVTISALNLPAGSRFQDNTFSWIPISGQAGKYEVAFVASDGQSETSQILVINILQASSSTAPYYTF